MKNQKKIKNSKKTQKNMILFWVSSTTKFYLKILPLQITLLSRIFPFLLFAYTYFVLKLLNNYNMTSTFK